MLINKHGIPVHPALHYYENSLSNGVRFYFDSINLHKKIRPINRLDKNTSGIVIFAKCEYIQEKMKKYAKIYLAIVNGFLNGSFTINKPIARKSESIIERCIDENGDNAITHIEVIKNSKDFSLVKCTLETGRTHQIRVHLASIGHPILGDSLYGKESILINRQALHAYQICFIHPITNKKIEITSDIPEDMKKIMSF